MIPTEINAADYSSVANAVLAANAAGGLPVFVPPGEWPVSNLTLTQPITLRGAGMGLTKLRVDNVADHGVIVNSGWCNLRDFDVFTTIPNRTGVGVKVAGKTNVMVQRVQANKHASGFWSQGSGNAFHDCSATYSTSHGFLFDGTAAPVPPPGQYEIEVNGCQSNNNSGDGFRFNGPALGVYLNRPTATANQGAGIRLVNVGTDHTTSVSDFSAVNVELSTNVGGEFISSSNWGGVGITLVGGLVEGNAQGIFFGQNVNNSAVSSIFIQAADNGIIVDGMGVTVSNITARNCNSVIRAGAHSTRLTLNGIVSTNPKTNGVGLFSDNGAGPIVGAALNFDAPTIHNALPAGSVFSASPGF
jgi:hypothetical protein